MNTVLITGCSTGFGRATAAFFLEQGWNVVATMRDPSANDLPASDRLRVLALDVTDAQSIQAAVAAAGPIDVLVNNAGIGWLNAIEGTSIEMVRRIFETNTFATIAMMQAVLPQMRERQSGVIVNVSSDSTVEPIPLLAVYRASKAAVNALTETAALELDQFGVRVRAVLPGGAPGTAFNENARTRIMDAGGFPEAYGDYIQQTLTAMEQASNGPVTTGEDVAHAVFRAATDPNTPMLVPAGANFRG